MKFKALCLLLSLPIAAIADVAGPTVTVQWDQLTVAQQTDVAGFYVYCSTVAGGPYMRMGQFSGSTLTSAVVPNCKALGSTGSAYFVASSYSVTGLESAFSREAVATWIAANPPTPVMVACVPPPPPVIVFIVSPISGQSDRPLYNAQFSVIGRVEILMPNGSPRICESTPVSKPGVTTKYYWVTNNSGLRGLAICKPK